MQECTIITWIWHDILTAETLYCFIYNYSKFNCFSLNKRLRDTILFVNTAEKKATSHFFSSIQSENYCCCNCSWIFGTSLLFLLFLCYGGKCYIFSPGFGWQRITAEKFITAKKKNQKNTKALYSLIISSSLASATYSPGHKIHVIQFIYTISMRYVLPNLLPELYPENILASFQAFFETDFIKSMVYTFL